MYEQQITSGKHLIFDIKNVENVHLLDQLEQLIWLFDFICEKYNFKILHKIHHRFLPFGITVIYMLEESHISIHTFPEKKYAAFDIYTCRNYPDNTIYNQIHSAISDFFASSNETPLIIDRNF